MALVSRGVAEITIIDTTDGRRLVSYISSNQMKQVIYDPDSGIYSPDYDRDGVTLTPNLKMEGSVDNIITRANRVTWFVQINSIDKLVEITNNETYHIDPTTKELQIRKNILRDSMSMKYICEIVYIDNHTGDEFVTLSDIELTKV